MVNNFGAYFVEELSIYDHKSELIGAPAQYFFDFGKKMKSKKWIRKTIRFTATGNEKGVILGNFKSDEETVATPIVSKKILKKKKSYRSHRLYTKIDSVSLRSVNSIEHDCDLDKNHLFIYQDSIRHSKEAPLTIDDISIEKIVTEEKVVAPEFPEPTPQKKEKEILPPPPIESTSFSIQTEKSFELPNITFETNSARLLTVAYQALDELANYLILNPDYTLIITGHTDAIGKSRDNQDLSERRAKAVATYLAGQGVRMHRFLTIGKGESSPITENETETGRQRNRRVEFKLE